MGGRRVHAPAEAVRLPADDCIEAAGAGVGQHPLELRALLGPTLAHFLIAGDDVQTPPAAIVLHVGDLLGDGGLVFLVLALARHAGVDGGPVRFCLGARAFLHALLPSLDSPETKRDPPPVESGSASARMPSHHLFWQVAPRLGVCPAPPGHSLSAAIPPCHTQRQPDSALVPTDLLRLAMRCTCATPAQRVRVRRGVQLRP